MCNEVSSRDPAFAMAACGDAVLAFESVVEAGTNAKQKHIQLACQLLSAALFNSSTNTVASISYDDNKGLKGNSSTELSPI